MLGVFVSARGALAQLIQAAFPGQPAGQVRLGGFVPQVGKDPPGICPRREPGEQVKDQLSGVSVGGLDALP